MNNVHLWSSVHRSDGHFPLLIHRVTISPIEDFLPLRNSLSFLKEIGDGDRGAASIFLSDYFRHTDGRQRRMEEGISKYSFLLSSTLLKLTWSCWDRIWDTYTWISAVPLPTLLPGQYPSASFGRPQTSAHFWKPKQSTKMALPQAVP